jgi:hypothetical protein
MAKAKTSSDEKFDSIDFNLFDALAAIDRKDYGYYDKLTEEQKKKFTPYMLVIWMCMVKANTKVQQYHVLATNEFANMYLFNENVQKHPKLQWLMLCSSGIGSKQFHQWVPQIKDRVIKLKEKAKRDDVVDFYQKTYPSADKELLKQIADQFIYENKRKLFFAEEFPAMKLDEIEVLNAVVSDDEIKQYEEQKGI